MVHFKTRILMAAAGVLALSACNVTQPKPGCTIGQGDFAAKYTPKAGETPTGACASLKGEIINLRDYTNEGTNYIGLRTANLGSLAPADVNPYSFGEYPKQSDAQSFCVASTLSPAHLQKSGSGSGGAVDRTYEWSNVRILVTSRAAGTQMTADLKYTDAVSGCSVSYDVVAMWPAIKCGTNGLPDDTKCATQAEPDKGIKIGCNAAGQCLSPDIQTHCDPDILLCVLNAPPTGE